MIYCRKEDDIKKHILTSQLFVGQPDQTKCIENIGFRVAVEHNINHILKKYIPE